MRRFDDMVQGMTAAPSRREALRTLCGTMLGILASRLPRPMAAHAADSNRRSCRSRLENGRQRGYLRCRRKQKRAQEGRVSLGPFAADCPPVTMCGLSDQTPGCRVGNTVGTCTMTEQDGPFCAQEMRCNFEFALCRSDADCQDLLGRNGKCLPCSCCGCGGGVMCALFAGDD